MEIPIHRSAEIIRSPRVMQVEGMFDLSPARVSIQDWKAHLDIPEDWNIGVIVGPSGAGKSTVARAAFGALDGAYDWGDSKSILDGFPKSLSIRDVVGLLTSVGFSSPPSWVRDFYSLSTGEQFRTALARSLAEEKDVVVVDEFTSTIDRIAAQVASAAVAKAVRRNKRKFVAVTCHYDVLDWLEPDWIYEPHLDKFTAGRSLQRPEIPIRIYPTGKETWAIFRKHHYLDTRLHTAAKCFVALWNDVPIAFSASIPFPRGKNSFANRRRAYREHRLVVLPDFQGIGIGRALSEFVGSLFSATNVAYYSRTSHPGFVASRLNHPETWRLAVYDFSSTKVLTMRSQAKQSGEKYKAPRKTATFEYIGPLADKNLASRLLAY